MDKLPTCEFVKHKSGKRLSPVLEKWIDLNIDMACSWKWKDCPWWCNERASVSVFAAAVWKAGGLALEEFCDEKLYRRSRYRGRRDLDFKFAGKTYTAETKHVWSAAVPRSKTPTSKIKKALEAASWEVKHIEEPETMLSIVFAVPYFRRSRKAELDQLLKKWQDQLIEIPCYNMAWVFPEKARHLLWEEDQCYYPGAAVILRRADEK